MHRNLSKKSLKNFKADLFFGLICTLKADTQVQQPKAALNITDKIITHVQADLAEIS